MACLEFFPELQLASTYFYLFGFFFFVVVVGFEQPKSVCILSKGFEKDCHYALLVEQIDTTK